MVIEEVFIKTIELDHSIINLRYDGIIVLITKDNTTLDVEDVRENAETFGLLSGGKKAPILIIGGAYSTVTKDARDFMATEESLKYSLCEAFLLKYLAQRILINFYIKVNKPIVPTKMFTNEDKAIEWLKAFI